MDRKSDEGQQNVSGQPVKHGEASKKPKRAPRLSKGSKNASTETTPEYVAEKRVRSSAEVLRRMNLTRDQMEEERKHWLEPLDSQEYKNRKYWQEKKKAAYFRAHENALQRQATLSDRQWFVARAISRGKNLGQIKEELNLGEDRINDLVAEIKRKANVSELQAIARWFLGH